MKAPTLRLTSALILALAAAQLLPLAAIAQGRDGFRALNNIVVVQQSPDSFAALFRSRAGDADYWCAAGQYAAVVLGLPAGTRLYRLDPPPRKRAQGIRFSLSPEGATPRTGLSVFGGGAATNSVAISTARSVCTRYLPREIGF